MDGLSAEQQALLASIMGNSSQAQAMNPTITPAASLRRRKQKQQRRRQQLLQFRLQAGMKTACYHRQRLMLSSPL